MPFYNINRQKGILQHQGLNSPKVMYNFVISRIKTSPECQETSIILMNCKADPRDKNIKKLIAFYKTKPLKKFQKEPLQNVQL